MASASSGHALAESVAVALELDAMSDELKSRVV